MRYIDTETCGFVGPIVLLQYSTNRDPVILYKVWEEPIRKTLRLLEQITADQVCGFNLSYDWFHIVKLYNMLKDHPRKGYAPEVKFYETYRVNRHDIVCLKPRAALDLLLTARKSEYQTLMERKPIFIRKIWRDVAPVLVKELEKRLIFDPIYFNNRPMTWSIKELQKPEREFVNLELHFHPTMRLKALIAHIFKIPTIEDAVPKWFNFEEKYYDPYDLAWVPHLDKFSKYWYHNPKAIQYATEDVLHLHRLDDHFGNPECGDNDSELACCVANVRYKGYAINIEAAAQRVIHIGEQETVVNVNSHPQVKHYLREVADPVMQTFIQSTDKKTLQKLAREEGELGKRAKYIIEARKGNKIKDLLSKLIEIGSFNPSFKVIGAKSGRMSGGEEYESEGRINPQGINREQSIREIFTLSDDPAYELGGGDFDSFEITIAAAIYQDDTLNRELADGLKFHALIGGEWFELTYEQLMKDKDLYNRAKTGVFSWLYGSMGASLANKMGLDEAQMTASMNKLFRKYPGIKQAQELIKKSFCTLYQADIGQPITYHEPANSVSTLGGYRRYYGLENKIVKGLLDLANNPPLSLKMQGVVERSKNRKQTVVGSCQSALFGAAFQLQQSNYRTAQNHVIQGTGAEITKHVQRKIWDMQPTGVGQFLVIPMNMHDEILTVYKRELRNDVKNVVDSCVEQARSIIPLIGMTWKTNMKNWGEK